MHRLPLAALFGQIRQTECAYPGERPDNLEESALFCTSPHALAAEQSNAVETSTFIGVARLVPALGNGSQCLGACVEVAKPGPDHISGSRGGIDPEPFPATVD